MSAQTHRATTHRLARKVLTVAMLSVMGTGLPTVWPRQAPATPTPRPSASVWAVSSCAASGPGSLREAVEDLALSGDTVDLSQLACSTVTLASNDILVAQDDLTIVGPGAAALTIDAWDNPYNTARIFNHTGDGTLQVSDVTISNPRGKTWPANQDGGCIHSSGNLQLNHVKLTACHLNTVGPAAGGAIHVAGNLDMAYSTVENSGLADVAITPYSYTLRGGGVAVDGDANISHSIITGNKASSVDQATLRGGGIHVAGTLTLIDSTVSFNRLHGDQSIATGGGIFAAGDLVMEDSTVALNSSESLVAGRAGGIWAAAGFDIRRSAIFNNSARRYGGMGSVGANSADPRVMRNTTVADNESSVPPAGLYVLGHWTLDNSTIAGNSATQSAPDGDAGIRAMLGTTMHGSIISNNTAAGVQADIASTVSGADNLIRAPGNSSVPSDTIIGQNPLLKDLADNGGSTLSMLTLRGSPARDAGSNPAGLLWDQRGPGYSRVSGSRVDIGALEFHATTLAIEPEEVDFHTILLGSTSTPHTVIVRNTGNGTVHVTTLEAPAAPFARTGGDCAAPPFDLPAFASCSIDYRFTPSWSGTSAAYLQVSSDAGNREIVLHGEAGPSLLAATPGAAYFEQVAVGETSTVHSITISNAGEVPLTMTGIDAAAPPFRAAGNSCGAPPVELAPQQSCQLDYRFSPHKEGPATQVFTVRGDHGNATFTLHANALPGDIIFFATFDP